MEDLPTEIKLLILQSLDFPDLVRVQLVSKSFYSLCQDNRLWKDCFHGFLEKTQLSVLDHYCFQDYPSSKEWNRFTTKFILEQGNNEQTTFLEDELHYWQSRTDSSYPIFAEALLVGGQDSKMETFFFLSKFGPEWRGINYLRTFGELLPLRFEDPPLRLLLSCWRLNEPTKIQYTQSLSGVYGVGPEEFPEKLGRVMIICLSRSGLKEFLKGGSQKYYLPYEQGFAESDEFVPLDRLQELLSRKEYLPVPVIFFINGEPDSPDEPLLMDVAKFIGLTLLSGNGERPWRIAYCNFDQSMDEVRRTLRWLYHALLEKCPDCN